MSSEGAYIAVSLKDDAPLTSNPNSFSPSSSQGTSPISRLLTWWKSLSLIVKGILLSAFLAVFIGVVVAAATLRKRGSGGAVTPSVCQWSSYRLPTNVLPLNYSLTWTPSLTPNGALFASGCSTPNGACPFTGTSSVSVLVQQASPCILIHSAGLTITSATVNGKAATWTEDAVNERLVVAMPSGAGVGIGSIALLTFTFTAPLSTTNTGLYQSTYKDDFGGTVFMVATQFEATSARHAFVSFDEPAFKANVSVTFDGVPAGYTVLSNMPNTSITLRPDGVSTRVTFAPTPPMSTYLVALVCGPLVSYSLPAAPAPGRPNVLPVTGWAVNRANNTLALVYAVQAAAAIIPYYETLFGVPFPLPKMDMVSIPDFAAGAMVSHSYSFITWCSPPPPFNSPSFLPLTTPHEKTPRTCYHLCPFLFL